MRDLEETIQWTMKYCQHYDPSGVTMIGGKEPHGHCKAGVNYLDQFGRAPDDGNHMLFGKYYPSSGIFQRMVCTKGGERSEEEQCASCPKWQRKTREQGIARFNEINDAIAQMDVVGKFLKTWRTWTKKNRVSKAEIVECPVCKGRLHLSQSSYNGHVHGKCETEGCVSWME